MSHEEGVEQGRARPRETDEKGWLRPSRIGWFSPVPYPILRGQFGAAVDQVAQRPGPVRDRVRREIAVAVHPLKGAERRFTVAQPVLDLPDQLVARTGIEDLGGGLGEFQRTFQLASAEGQAGFEQRELPGSWIELLDPRDHL